MRTIEVPTDIFPEFELRDTVVDLQRGRKERKAREGEEAQQQKEEEVRRKEAKAEELHLQKEGHPEKRPGQKEVTPKQRLLEERRDHHSHVSRRGTWPMYITLILTRRLLWIS